MTPGAWTYVAIFAGSAFLALGLTPLALRFAVRKQILDHPERHKSHSHPVPYLGGLAIVIAFAAAVMVASLLRPPPSGLEDLGVILGLGVALSIVGLIDDLRGLHVWFRLAFQLVIACAVWGIGSGVALFADTDWLNLLVTVVWIVGITNAFNLLDNMDGLSAGIAAIAALSFFVVAAINGQLLVAALAIALAGCALGFLRHNFHPARIYMGDAGSLFLGFLLAVIGIRLRFGAPTYVTFFVPVLILGVAIFDTVLVTVSRLLHGRNPLSGGRDHVSHRLVFVGIPVRGAVALIYATGLVLGWLAVIMSRVDVATGFMLMALVVSVGIFAAVLLGVVPIYDSSSRRRFMIQEVQGHEDTTEMRRVRV